MTFIIIILSPKIQLSDLSSDKKDQFPFICQSVSYWISVYKNTSFIAYYFNPMSVERCVSHSQYDEGAILGFLWIAVKFFTVATSCC